MAAAGQQRSSPTRITSNMNPHRSQQISLPQQSERSSSPRQMVCCSHNGSLLAPYWKTCCSLYWKPVLQGLKARDFIKEHFQNGTPAYLLGWLLLLGRFYRPDPFHSCSNKPSLQKLLLKPTKGCKEEALI